jgi:hypothetical protein
MNDNTSASVTSPGGIVKLSTQTRI